MEDEELLSAVRKHLTDWNERTHRSHDDPAPERHGLATAALVSSVSLGPKPAGRLTAGDKSGWMPTPGIGSPKGSNPTRP